VPVVFSEFSEQNFITLSYSFARSLSFCESRYYYRFIVTVHGSKQENHETDEIHEIHEKKELVEGIFDLFCGTLDTRNFRVFRFFRGSFSQAVYGHFFFVNGYLFSITAYSARTPSPSFTLSTQNPSAHPSQRLGQHLSRIDRNYPCVMPFPHNSCEVSSWLNPKTLRTATIQWLRCASVYVPQRHRSPETPLLTLTASNWRQHIRDTSRQLASSLNFRSPAIRA